MSREARERILARIRASRPASAPLPEPYLAEVGLGGPHALRSRFAAALEDAEGHCETLPGVDAVSRALAELPEWRDSPLRCANVQGVAGATVRLDEMAVPHALAGLGCAALRGVLGVAENGAVWVELSERAHRAACFLAEHVVLVVPADALVPTMHEAYAQLALGAPGFAGFVAGPSKTADIEQSLVVGAHGPRSLRVILVEAGL